MALLGRIGCVPLCRDVILLDELGPFWDELSSAAIVSGL